MTNPDGGPHVKVHFRLEVEDDWPPAPVETLWAVDQGDGTARLDNVSGEGIEHFGMVALNVPPAANHAKVQRLLNHGVAKEWGDMEEGCITDQWRAASAD